MSVALASGSNLMGQSILEMPHSGSDSVHCSALLISRETNLHPLLDINIDGMRASASLKLSWLEIGVSAENILYSVWSDGQLESETPMFIEAPVPEVISTPEAPFFVKGNIAFRF